MSTRAKFYVAEVEQFGPAIRAKLFAVFDDGIPENERFARASPFGELVIVVDNPPAAEQFKQGRIAYIDINWTDER